MSVRIFPPSLAHGASSGTSVQTGLSNSSPAWQHSIHHYIRHLKTSPTHTPWTGRHRRPSKNDPTRSAPPNQPTGHFVASRRKTPRLKVGESSHRKVGETKQPLISAQEHATSPPQSEGPLPLGEGSDRTCNPANFSFIVKNSRQKKRKETSLQNTNWRAPLQTQPRAAQRISHLQLHKALLQSPLHNTQLQDHLQK